MALSSGAIVVASVASYLLAAHAIRNDDSKRDSPPVGIAQLNSSTETLTLDDCNSLLFTIMTKGKDGERQETMLVIRDALFKEKGLDILASLMSDGAYKIEVDQALRTDGSHVGESKLIVHKGKTADRYKGVFHIGGHRLAWSAFTDGRFEWHKGASSRRHIHLGKQALAGSSFLIVGCAFIAECLTPQHAGVAAKDAMEIFDSAVIFTGSGSIDTAEDIAKLLTEMPVAELRDLFATKCGAVLKLSVGDVIAPIVPPPKQKPEGAALSDDDEEESDGKSMRFVIQGI